MDALSTIIKAGFDVTLDGDNFEISPASALTLEQREFLKLHKSEIITELQTRQSDLEPPLIKCRDCLNFKYFNAHGKGAGTCLAGVQPSGSCWWGDTLHQCVKYDAAVEWHELPETFSPNALIVQCYTPSGKLIEVEATSPEPAAFLQRMNPLPTKEKS